MISRKDLKTIKVVLVGQPNVGKSSLFNVLSGKTTRVSNWAGTTVEIKTGRVKYREYIIELVDIPGTYSLTPASVEERVAREYIIKERADVYVVLVDTLTIERSLLLAIELLELRGNVVIALTKYDIAHKYGIHVNIDGLSRRLSVPVVAVSAYTGEGIEDLLNAIIRTYKSKNTKELVIDYGEIENYIKIFQNCGEKVRDFLKSDVNTRWITIKLIEGDEELLRILEEVDYECYRNIIEFREKFKEEHGKLPEDIILEFRKKVVERVLEGNVVKARVSESLALSNIDRFFMNPVIGPILSILLLSLIICSALIINMGFPANVVLYALGFRNLAELVEKYSISGILSNIFDYFASIISSIVHNSVVSNLICGVVESFGAVISLAPLVFIMSVILAIFEDSGLGARMAVALHSIMSRFGLSGRSVYPIMIGFGCNVPAVLASRTAIEYYERKQIALSVPLIPCQARFLVLLYILTSIVRMNPLLTLISVFSIVSIGVFLCLITSLMLRRMFKISESPELLLEIPPIHPPKLRVIWWISWSTTRHFLEKAGTVIFASCLVIWLLLHYGPSGYVINLAESYAARLGDIVGILFEHLYSVPHIYAWKLGLATIAGMIAKENIIAVLDLIGLNGISMTQVIAFTVFTMLYMPCISTLAVLCREVGIRYALLITVYMFILAIVISYVSYIVLGCI